MPFPTRSFEKPSVQDRFRALPANMLVEEVCRMGRSAGLLFLSRAASGMGKEQLRTWLVLEYEGATVFTNIGEPLADDPIADLSEEEAELLVHQARTRVLRMLEGATRTWNVASFAKDMIENGLVVRVSDRRGFEGYAPVASPNMRLVDRVASLFIADFLTTPAPYAFVSACEACGEVTIGGRPHHAEWCVEPPTHSGIMERTRPSRRVSRITLKGVGETLAPAAMA
jgi:hypothetical protein